MSTATVTDRSVETNGKSNRLTETLEENLSHPATSPDFDLKKGVNEVLADVGMTSDDCGGELSFYGSDPILPKPAAVRDNGCNWFGCEERSGGRSLETSHRRRTEYLSGRTQGAAAFLPDFLRASGKPSMADRPRRVAMRLVHS